jgi:HK97 family phage major capsid protein
MATDIKQAQEQVGSTFHLFQQYLDEKLGAVRTEVEALKSNHTLTGEDKTLLERLQADMNAQAADLKRLQVAANAPGGFGISPEMEEKRLQVERKNAFNKVLRNGVGSLSQEERKHIKLDVEAGVNTEYKAMYSNDATTGGFLTTPEYVNQLIEFIVLVSPMPGLVDMRYTVKPWVMTPRVTQVPSAVRVAEQATRTETQNPRFGLVQNFPYESYAFTLVSRTDLDDAELDLGEYLMRSFSTQFAKLQGFEYLLGRGSNSGESLGLLNDPVINNGGNGSVTTAATGALDYPALVKLKQSLKPNYWPSSTWIFTNETLGAIQMLTDSQNRPLWVPFGGTLPETLFGRPYVIMPDMPQMAANGGSAGALAIAVGSFKDAYQGVVRKQVSMQTLYERYADQNAVGFFAYFRFGGTVKLQEAVKTLRVKP